MDKKQKIYELEIEVQTLENVLNYVFALTLTRSTIMIRNELERKIEEINMQIKLLKSLED